MTPALTPDLKQRVVAMLRAGNGNRVIAAATGCSIGRIAGLRRRWKDGTINNTYERSVKITAESRRRGGIAAHANANGHAEVRGGGRQMEALGRNDCRYPIGDPGSKSFRFCARQQQAGSPYCPDHHACCYSRAMTDESRERSQLRSHRQEAA